MFPNIEKLEGEAGRVAAAFKVHDGHLSEGIHHGYVFFGGFVCGSKRVRLEARFSPEGVLLQIDLDTPNLELVGIRRFSAESHDWEVFGWGEADFEFMARGLYCLGFDNPSAQLADITFHEKLELRLSMPREFWPQKWLDEKKETD